MDDNFAKDLLDFVNVNFTKDPLNFNKIDTRSIDGNFMKKPQDFGTTNLHSMNIKLTESPPNFCETNPLNVYQWRAESSRIFTHSIYHNIDTYDDCHIQIISLMTHGRAIDIFRQFNYPIKFDRACNKTLQERIYMSVMGLSMAPMAQHFLV